MSKSKRFFSEKLWQGAKIYAKALQDDLKTGKNTARAVEQLKRFNAGRINNTIAAGYEEDAVNYWLNGGKKVMPSANDIKARLKGLKKESREDIPEFTLDLLDSRNIRYHFDNGRLCVDQDLSEVYQGLKDLTPLKGIWKINGSLFLNRNHLKSLDGCPEIIEGDLIVSANKLESLRGCPKFVGGNLDVSWNYKLKSLAGVGEVVGDIVVHHTPLDPNFDPSNPLGDYEESAPKSRMRAFVESVLTETMNNENSLGKPIAKDEESLKAFWDWFDGSKVVDSQGRPLVVYHGTKHTGITKFVYDPQRQTGDDFGEAYYATDSEESASGYGYSPYKDKELLELQQNVRAIMKKAVALMGEDGEKTPEVEALLAEHKKGLREMERKMAQGRHTTTGGVVMPLYMNMRNPLVYDAKGEYYYKVYPKLFETARSKGNDGIIVKNVMDNPNSSVGANTVFIVFDNHQIKSIENKGTWNPSTNNIYESISENENSLGLPIARSEESLDKFWKWFGNSKMVDHQGRPMTMYHGTSEKFRAFAKGRIGSNQGSARGEGFYFTADRRMADEYGSRVVSVYLKIENPLTEESIKGKENALLDLYLDPNESDSTREIVANYVATKTRSVMAATDFISGIARKRGQSFADVMHQLGFDGVIEGDQVVVLEPTQIKSVDNFGEWNPSSEDIYESSAF